MGNMSNRILRRLGVALVVCLMGVTGGIAQTPEGAFLRSGRIAFMSRRDGSPQIFIMNADGSNVTRVTSGPGGNYSPAFSPDGTRIVFQSNWDGNLQIYMMDADGSNVTRLTKGLFVQDAHPTFSPDGTRIAFHSDRDRTSRGRQIYVMNVDGSNVTRLTNDGYLPTFGP
jgi:Tol biopolymer transport system component